MDGWMDDVRDGCGGWIGQDEMEMDGWMDGVDGWMDGGREVM